MTNPARPTTRKIKATRRNDRDWETWVETAEFETRVRVDFCGTIIPEGTRVRVIEAFAGSHTVKFEVPGMTGAETFHARVLCNPVE